MTHENKQKHETRMDRIAYPKVSFSDTARLMMTPEH